MAYSQSSPGDTPSPEIGEASDDNLDIYQNQNRRSRTTSPKPALRNQQSAANSRASSPNPLAFLHEGLVKKVRVLRADATSHPTDMLVCPSDPTLSAKWCNLTAKIHEAAGPKLANLVSNRYSAGISNPPSQRWSEYVNDNDIESPFKSFFNTVKHSPSFEMTNCDWLAHSCVPSYSHTNGRDVESLNDRQINERNNEKYNSVYLVLKKAHLVALVHWTRAFSIAIPQVQYDGEFYTPRDDAILTLAAIVDFFNHPVWGARRCNTIKRVDIIIDPTDDGLPYVEAYDFAWHVMNMHSKGKDIIPLIGSKKGFLRRPFPIYRPPLPARDPDANYQPPRLMHDVLSLPTDIETTDNSQQVPESQEWNLLEQARLDEDGDSIFGEFIQDSISDFQDSDAGLGNSPLNFHETMRTGSSSLEQDERTSTEGTLIASQEDSPRELTPPITSYPGNRNGPRSSAGISSHASLSPPPIDKEDTPPFRSSSPSPEYIPSTFPALRSPTDDAFNTPTIPGLNLLKTALENSSPQTSPLSRTPKRPSFSFQSLHYRLEERELPTPKITITPPQEAFRDRVAKLKDRRSSEAMVSSPLASSVINTESDEEEEWNLEDVDAEENPNVQAYTDPNTFSLDQETFQFSTSQEVTPEPSPTPPRTADSDNISEDEDVTAEEDSLSFESSSPDPDEETPLHYVEDKTQEILQPFFESDSSLSDHIPDEFSSEENENEIQDTAPSPTISTTSTLPSHPSPRSPQQPTQQHNPLPPPPSPSASNSTSEADHHPEQTQDDTSASQDPEPESDTDIDIDIQSPSHSSEPSVSDSASEFEGPPEGTEDLSPTSPMFGNHPRGLRREVEGLTTVGETLDGEYWNQRGPRMRRGKRKRRGSEDD